MAGEYGSAQNTRRPHYHALIFGLWPDDAEVLRTTKQGHKVYRSEQIEKLWGKGMTEFGSLTYQSAAYTSRYIMKKINGKRKDEIDPTTGLKHYETVDPITGDIHELTPEFNNMSRRPGIGKEWWENYKSDIYPSDTLHLPNGQAVTPPRYYDILLGSAAPGFLEDLRENRKVKAKKWKKHQTPQRLKAAETIKKQSLNQLKRDL